MKKIKFSNEYNKFFGAEKGEPLKLLQVFVLNFKDLSKSFIEYDTITTKGTKYDLPRGKLIALLFYIPRMSSSFTTVRRWTPQKEEYYRASMGEAFKMEIMK